MIHVVHEVNFFVKQLCDGLFGILFVFSQRDRWVSVGFELPLVVRDHGEFSFDHGVDVPHHSGLIDLIRLHFLFEGSVLLD